VHRLRPAGLRASAAAGAGVGGVNGAPFSMSPP
jgi:hypothetical protein